MLTALRFFAKPRSRFKKSIDKKLFRENKMINSTKKGFSEPSVRVIGYKTDLLLYSDPVMKDPFDDGYYYEEDED